MEFELQSLNFKLWKVLKVEFWYMNKIRIFSIEMRLPRKIVLYYREVVQYQFHDW